MLRRKGQRPVSKKKCVIGNGLFLALGGFLLGAILAVGVVANIGLKVIHKPTNLHEENESKKILPTNLEVTSSYHVGKHKPQDEQETNGRSPVNVPPQPPLVDEHGARYHVVFSTDCSDYQHWQSYLLFYSAMKIGQPGDITRIASGCSQEETAQAKEWHETHVSRVMSDRFRIHFTPKFSSVQSQDGTGYKKEYKYFNKPFGLRHFIEEGEGMGVDPGTGKVLDEDAVIILLDPDMVLLRPIGIDFSEGKEVLVKGEHRKNRKYRVEHGSPFAQKYGFGGAWTANLDVAKIAGEDSPATLLSRGDAARGYAVGPPYIATARDMHSIAVKWTEFAPKVHAQLPKLMAEMFAYCSAAAHLELPHQIVSHLMVSNVGAPLESWNHVDDIPHAQICEFASNLHDTDHPLPSTVHYCQPHKLEEWLFSKRKMPKDFFTCESPLMAIPPMDVALKYSYKVPPNLSKDKTPAQNEEYASRLTKRTAFVLCAMISALNEAAEFFMQNHCDGVGGANNAKTIRI